MFLFGLIHLTAAESVNQTEEVDRIEEINSNLKNSLNQSINFKNYLNDKAAEISQEYGLNRLNLSLATLILLVAVASAILVAPDRKDRLKHKKELEELEENEELPEAEKHEDLKIRIEQLETQVKNMDKSDENLLDKLGEAYRLRTMNKASEAEELVKEVEDKV